MGSIPGIRSKDTNAQRSLSQLPTLASSLGAAVSYRWQNSTPKSEISQVVEYRRGVRFPHPRAPFPQNYLHLPQISNRLPRGSTRFGSHGLTDPVPKPAGD